ncbi:MAG TPA: response regulator transcription factor [Terriglobales bacterium]|jgi:DNA-binding NarL/FixJ family response regulator
MQLGAVRKAVAPIDVYLVVENRLLREALVRLFLKQTDIKVVGQNAASETSAKQAIACGADIILLDSLGSASQLHILSELAKSQSDIRTILFGMEEDPKCFLKAVRLGVCGYLLKDASSVEVVSAVRSVMQGDAVCPPKLCMALFSQVSLEFREKSGMADNEACVKAGLTFRQRQLVSLVAKGMSNKEIASNLNLSEFTVKNHIYRIMKQLEAESRQEAVDLIRDGGYLADVRWSI